MIIKLRYGQPQLKLRLVEAACTGTVLSKDGLSLVIREPELDPKLCVRTSPWVIEGCWPHYRGPHDTTPPPKPSLVYPAFDMDDDGSIIFQLDNKLSAWPPGRYLGTVVNRDGIVLASLDFDLQSTPYIIDRVEVREENACA